MKKIKKIICAVLCLLVCLSLCSCNFIDKMREAQTFKNENGDIVYKEKAYKPLPQCSDFNPEQIIDFNKTIYLTDDDVPVLLSEIYGFYLDVSKDDKLLCSFDNVYYAREDIYSSLKERIESHDYFDGYAFEYDEYTYDEKEDIYPQSSTRYSMIDNETYLAVLDVLENYEPDVADPVLIKNYYITALWLSSNDFYFIKYVTGIYQTPTAIYISSEDSTGTTRLYRIPDKYNDMLQTVIDDYNSLNMTYEDACEKFGIEDDYYYDDYTEKLY